MAEKPAYRLIRKNLQTNKWDSIGGAWERDQGGFSVSIELERGGEKIKCLMVKNEPKDVVKSNIVNKPVETATNQLDDSIPF